MRRTNLFLLVTKASSSKIQTFSLSDFPGSAIKYGTSRTAAKCRMSIYDDKSREDALQERDVIVYQDDPNTQTHTFTYAQSQFC